METSKINLLKLFSEVSTKIEKSELKEENISEVLEQVQTLCDYFDISPIQLQILICLFILRCDNESASIKDIALFFNIKPLKILFLKQDFEFLVNREFIGLCQEQGNIPKSFIDFKFQICDSTVNKIINVNNFNQIQNKHLTVNCCLLFKEISNVIEKRKKNLLSTKDLFQQVKEIEKQYQKLHIVKQLKKLRIEINDRILFYEICDDILNQGYKSSLRATVKDIYDNTFDWVNISNILIEEKHFLQQSKLVEIENSSSNFDYSLSLTEKGFLLALGEESFLFKKENMTKQATYLFPEKLIKKALYFSETTDKQINLLYDALHEENYHRLTQQLREKKLSKGIVCLFYGPPGTGKTEAVYQLAKSTQRTIMQVDISETKTSLYGESQRLTKQIFTQYKNYSKTQKQIPILLFNEADALFSKRIKQILQNADQTQNAIQNILLEELENFEGILIATTNIADNFDSAFERRFLFKIEFEKPDKKAKLQIWQSKLPYFSETDYDELSTAFDFSGGQIDNIVKKINLHNAIYDSELNFDKVLNLCHEEQVSFNKKYNKIGF